MNNTARFLSIAAVAAFASFGAQADEADASQFATQFQTNRTRAEVAAEANRMREKLSAVNASIAANVGEGLWKEVQGAVAQARAGK